MRGVFCIGKIARASGRVAKIPGIIRDPRTGQDFADILKPRQIAGASNEFVEPRHGFHIHRIEGFTHGAI